MRTQLFSLGFSLASIAALAGGCKNDDSSGGEACKTIGPDGGTLASSDGVFNLALRPDSLSEDTTVCIEVADRPPEGPPFVYSEAYRVKPDIDLRVNASITFQHRIPDDLSRTAIGTILREDFDSGQGRWIPLQTTRVEPNNDVIAATDSRLSMFYGILDDATIDPTDPTVASTTQGTSETVTESGTTNPVTTETESVSATMVVETESTTGDPTTSPTEPETSSTTGETETDTESESESETSGFACDSLPAGPYTITLIGNPFAGFGSEDIAMTGDGSFVGASGNMLLESNENAATEEWFAPLTAQVFGLRFNTEGNIVAINRATNNIDVITMGGAQTPLVVTGWNFANGIFPDLDGNIWATSFGDGIVYRVNPDLTVDEITPGATANGVFYDENRSMLFYTIYGQGQLWRIPIAGDGTPGAAVMVADLAGLSDGVTLDVCGNAYVVDQAGGGGMNPCRLDRVWIDENGDLGPNGVEEIAAAGTMGNGCSNAQFGFGFGDDLDETLFMTSDAGAVHTIEVGVPGHPIAGG